MKKLITTLICAFLLLSIAACNKSGPDTNQPDQSGQTSSQQSNQPSSQPSSQPSGQTSGQQSAQPPAAKVTDTVTVAFSVDPGSLAPFTGVSATDFILFNMYDSLFRMSDPTGEITPLIAESYNISDDGLTYTFNIRKGVKDSAGNVITAHDCDFSWRLYAQGPMAMNVSAVDFDKTGAVDDYTYVVILTSPGQTYMAQFGKVYIISEKAYNESPDEMITTPVTTGPYRLSEWVQGSYVKLVANEDYYGAAPDIKNLEFKIISEATQRTIALMTGEVNFVYDYLISDADYIKSEGYIVEARNTNTVYSVFFNNSGKFASDINFRKAVSLSIDNVGLTSMIYRNVNTPATTAQSRNAFDYSPAWEGNMYYNYDPAEAKVYLDQSNYDGSSIVLLTKSNVFDFDKLCEAVQDSLRQIGVIAEIQQYDAATLATIRADAANWELLITDHSTFSGFGVDSIHNTHVRSNQLLLPKDLYDLFDEYGRKGLYSPNAQESAEYLLKTLLLNQDEVTTHAICYATFKFAYVDYLSNINLYSTNKIAWNEIIIGEA